MTKAEQQKLTHQKIWDIVNNKVDYAIDGYDCLFGIDDMEFQIGTTHNGKGIFLEEWVEDKDTGSWNTISHDELMLEYGKKMIVNWFLTIIFKRIARHKKELKRIARQSSTTPYKQTKKCDGARNPKTNC